MPGKRRYSSSFNVLFQMAADSTTVGSTPTSKETTMARSDDDDPVDERSMFMEVLRIEPGEDLVHLILRDNGADGEPEADGESLAITVPLSQFEPVTDGFAAAFESPAYAAKIAARVKAME